MTLEAHTPEQLDELALAALDVAGAFRNMANSCRENDLQSVSLHSRKPREWLSRLLEWTHKAAAEVGREERRWRARMRAQSVKPYRTSKKSKTARK